MGEGVSQSFLHYFCPARGAFKAAVQDEPRLGRVCETLFISSDLNYNIYSSDGNRAALTPSLPHLHVCRQPAWPVTEKPG